ncbi:type IV secretory system conjugative DNA transfer VirD4/TraG family protein [Methylobacter tundripaludum]|uniref:Type IV secretory system conjugative DNA transfer VirD4/TraG family protein n=1 Tax=Methylobacter tundripaludum TaxID=173365 RepID=A0A2S6GGF6_9GAMM|nr:type IV secretory system conjugative DNA transfer family protein [Methylobacter tundripaludum]PPK64275.1 type IV secretory system conjugative DNA transfer VirD4/TraG family protein [Methylobacter tundripaludum]
MFVWFIDALESLVGIFVWMLNYPYQLFGGLLLLLLRPWTWLTPPPSHAPAYVKNLPPEAPQPGTVAPEPAAPEPEAATPPPQEPQRISNPCVLYDKDPMFWQRFFAEKSFGGALFDVAASVTVEKRTGYKFSHLGEWEEVDHTFYFEKETNKIALDPSVRFSFSMYYQLYLTKPFPEDWLVECEKTLLKIQTDWELNEDNRNDSDHPPDKKPSTAKQKQEKCAELMQQIRTRVISRGWLHLLPIFEGSIYQRAWMSSLQGLAVFEQPWGASIRFGTLENGEELEYSGDMSILTVAHTGSGKTKSLILPNLATYTGGVMCLDATGERYAQTASYREAMGQKVWRFDPFGDDNAAAFNLLSVVRRTPVDMWGDAEKLAAVFAPTGKGSHVFWNDAVQELLAVLICHCILDAESHEQAATLKDLIDTVNSDFKKLERILKSCTKSEEIWSLDTHARNVLGIINGKGYFTSVPQSLKNALKDWNNPRLLANTSRTDWTPDELLNGSASVFFATTPDKMTTEGAIMRAFFEAHIIALLAERPATKPESPLLCVFDELLQLPPLKTLEQAMLADHDYGLRFWLVVSSTAALHNHYGKAINTIMETCKIKTFSNAKGQAAKDLSNQLGYVKHPLMTAKRPLITAPELASAEFEAFHVVIITGAPPAKVKKHFFEKLKTETHD